MRNPKLWREWTYSYCAIFFMTGQIPTPEQTRQLSAELADRGELPKYVEQLIDSYVPRYPALPRQDHLTFVPSAYRRLYIP